MTLKASKAKGQLISYGNKELTQLVTHYGSSIIDVFQENEKYVGPDIDADQTKTVWFGFKYVIFQKRQANYHIIGAKISAVKMPTFDRKERVSEGCSWKCNSFSPRMLWESFSHNPVKYIYPNIMCLLYVLNIFAISAACFERYWNGVTNKRIWR